MVDKSVDIGRSIKRALQFLITATVVLYLGLGGLTYWAWQGQQTNHDALCTFRGDLEKRVANSRDFLKENPEGIPGIPAMTLRTSITNQESTIAALSDLSC